LQARDLTAATTLLDGWLAWAQRSRLAPFAKLAKTIKKYRQLILNAVEHGLSNARTEATNPHAPTYPPRLRLPQPPNPSSP
jgi:transposase